MDTPRKATIRTSKAVSGYFVEDEDGSYIGDGYYYTLYFARRAAKRYINRRSHEKRDGKIFETYLEKI